MDGDKHFLIRLHKLVKSVVRQGGGVFAPLRKIYSESAFVQSVYSAVLVAFRRGKLPVDRPEAYIQGVKQKKVANFLRKELGRRGERATVRLPAGEIPGPDGDPAHLAEKRDRDRKIHSVIRGCTWRQQEVFRLIFVKGWSEKQVAGHLGVDKRTIRRDKVVVLRAVAEAMGEEA